MKKALGSLALAAAFCAAVSFDAAAAAAPKYGVRLLGGYGMGIGGTFSEVDEKGATHFVNLGSGFHGQAEFFAALGSSFEVAPRATLFFANLIAGNHERDKRNPHD